MSCCYLSLGTMLYWVLFVSQLMFYVASGCVVEERIALMRVRSLLMEEADSNVPESWGQSDDCCSWKGIRCNNNSRVLDLYLTNDFSSLYFDGDGCRGNLNLTVFSSFHELQLLDLSWNVAYFQSIDGLQGLTKLRYLNLSHNCLVGNKVFESLGKLASLEVINIDSCGMSGALQSSDFENLKNLRELRLGSNQYNGSIPASLFELPRLEYLDLSGNLLQGHIPISSSSNISSSLKVLRLSKNNLNGLFDFFWLRNCTMLKKVDLSGNSGVAIDVKFRRRVPLFQLRELMLSGCKLDDSIISGPNFLGTQSHLRILDLSNNSLTGSIPSWINTTSLVYLNLANNSLVGSLDLMWQYQSNLEMIDISMNHFKVGQLPPNISSVFPNLTILNASYNIIYGHLPPSLCNISNLRFVDLSNNKLTGEVPTCLFTDCTTLGVLRLSNNSLGGLIFGGASSLSTLEEIYLDSNKFEGALPNNLSGNPIIMDLHDNKLSGELDVLWNLSSLEVLSVAGNSLAGEICPAICKFIDLHFLDMSDNKFSGSIPNCDSKLNPQYLNMSSNTLSGFLSAFCNSSSLTVLDLRYNQFKRSLDWIYGLSQINILLLGGNKFGGQISPNLCQLQYLNIIDLSHNRLSGLLPPCIGGISFGYHMDMNDFFHYSMRDVIFVTGFSDLDSPNGPNFYHDFNYDLRGFSFSTKGNIYTYGHNFFDQMSGIDLSANMLSGEIPWEIGNWSNVKSLNLSHNSFTGRIPATFANMSAIESLDLSYNQLSGPIPLQLTRMSSLEVFSVAYNNLSGCIPNSGQFSSFSVESYLGNANLHNLTKGNQCSSVPSPVEEDDVGELPADPVLYIISAASFVVAFWATTAFLFCHSFGQRVILQL